MVGLANDVCSQGQGGHRGVAAQNDAKRIRGVPLDVRFGNILNSRFVPMVSAVLACFEP
jgi:hypothetical protein